MVGKSVTLWDFQSLVATPLPTTSALLLQHFCSTSAALADVVRKIADVLRKIANVMRKAADVMGNIADVMRKIADVMRKIADVMRTFSQSVFKPES